MELTILEAKNAPEKPVVAVCMGAVRRQVRMEVNRPFQLPYPGANEKGVQVTIFQQLTSQAMPLLGNASKKEEVAYHIPVEMTSGAASEVKLRVRRLCCESGGSCAPSGEPAKQKVSSAGGDTTMDDAREYLNTHGLQQRIQDLIQDVLREQPEEPYKFMLQNLRSNKGSTAPRPQRPKEEAIEEVLQKATAPLVPKPPDKPCPTNASPRKAQNMMAARKVNREEAQPTKEEELRAQVRCVIRMCILARCGSSTQAAGNVGIRDQARASIRELLVRSSSILSEKQQPEHKAEVRYAASLAYRSAADVIGKDPVRRQECF